MEKKNKLIRRQVPKNKIPRLVKDIIIGFLAGIGGLVLIVLVMLFIVPATPKTPVDAAPKEVIIEQPIKTQESTVVDSTEEDTEEFNKAFNEAFNSAFDNARAKAAEARQSQQ